MNPLVSVVIPTLNRHGMLLKAIDSVLSQTYKIVEVVVIDDCSDVELSISSISVDPRVRVFRNENRMGGAYSRAKGVSLSKGDYIAFLDDDDVYYPSKLQSLLQCFDMLEMQKINVDVVFGKVERSDGRQLKKCSITGCTVLKEISLVSMLHTNGSLVKRAVFNDVNFHPSLKKYHLTLTVDYYLIFKM